MEQEDSSVEKLAKEVAMSRSQLHRKLVALTINHPVILSGNKIIKSKGIVVKKNPSPLPKLLLKLVLIVIPILPSALKKNLV